jgi:hypothetical protein
VRAARGPGKRRPRAAPAQNPLDSAAVGYMMSHVHRRISLAEGTRSASRAQQLGPYDGTPADGAIRARQAEGRTHPDTRRRDICATRGRTVGKPHLGPCTVGAQCSRVLAGARGFRRLAAWDTGPAEGLGVGMAGKIGLYIPVEARGVLQSVSNATEKEELPFVSRSLETVPDTVSPLRLGRTPITKGDRAWTTGTSFKTLS